MRYSISNAIPHNPKSKKHPYENLVNVVIFGMFFAGMIWYNRIIKTILRACPKHGCGNVRT